MRPTWRLRGKRTQSSRRTLLPVTALLDMACQKSWSNFGLGWHPCILEPPCGAPGGSPLARDGVASHARSSASFVAACGELSSNGHSGISTYTTLASSPSV